MSPTSSDGNGAALPDPGMSAGTGETGSPWVRVSSASQMIMPALARLPRAQQEAAPPRRALRGRVGTPGLAGGPGQGARASQALLPSYPVVHF